MMTRVERQIAITRAAIFMADRVEYAVATRDLRYCTKAAIMELLQQEFPIDKFPVKEE